MFPLRYLRAGSMSYYICIPAVTRTAPETQDVSIPSMCGMNE